MERLSLWRACLVALAILVAVTVPQAANAAVTVKTVPLDPANPTAPHFTYPLDASHEVTIVLGATVDLGGSADSFTYKWDFGDGTSQAAIAVTNPYDISAQHQYPFGAAGGTTWTAVVTVTDTNTSATYTANYYVIQQANNLASRVDVAIDSGLWYLHTNMWRCTNGSPSPCKTGGLYGTNGIYGGWDCALGNGTDNANNSCGGGYTSSFATATTASNVQAFEVNSHFENGPASDPYTDDVARGLARVFMFMHPQAVASKAYNYNLPSCPNGAITPCTVTFDGNTNGQMLFDSGDVYYPYPFYQGGQLIDAIVASANPAGSTHTGVAAGGGLLGVQGQTYKNIVQDMIDGYNYCQNNHTPGGAWAYQCNVNGSGSYNDNSVSQWGAIGEIGADRGFGISVPALVMDANSFWATQDLCTAGIYSGSFGYNGACSLAWGPFATTPSGMVQLAMDQVGRGDSRWNASESYYRNSFCSPPASGPTVSPRQYTYGLFSFTKSMLLHNPGGVLTPITLLADQPGNGNPINWYSAVGPESGGSDACDGVAQTLVKRQGVTGGNGGSVGSPNPTNPQNGYWEGHYYTGAQDPFETGWSIIMLRRTVFVACVNNLGGKGTPSGRAAARIDLTWTGISGAASYDVLRGTASGGPYTKIGNSTIPGYSDKTGLVNGDTYYYVLQPLNNAGGAVCQSNQATIAIPATGR